MKTHEFLSRVPDKKIVAVALAIGIVFLAVGLCTLGNHDYAGYRICGAGIIVLAIVHAWPERNT